MSSSPQMIQVYQDEEGGAGEHAPFLPSAPRQPPSRPRWARHSGNRSRLRRAALAGGAFLTMYLLFCAWFAYHRNEILDSYHEASEYEIPHPKLPWPFPKHPHPPPHHPHPPHPTVLGCKPVPTPTSISSLASVELKVTIPGHSIVVLEDHLLRGDVSVNKVVEEDSELEIFSEKKNLTVGITVANRTCPHHPPPPESAVPFPEEPGKEKEDKKFVLCALAFAPPHHHKSPPPPEEAASDEKPGHPHPVPHHPPPLPHVIVAVLPAHNETYPKLPGHHHPPPPPPSPPPEHPPHDVPGDDEEEVEAETEVEMVDQSASVFSRAWRSTVSFLFPMLSLFEESTFPKHWPHPFPHHPPHGPPHHPPPPPPPFVVTSLTASVPKWTPVKYGLPFKPLRRRWRH